MIYSPLSENSSQNAHLAVTLSMEGLGEWHPIKTAFGTVNVTLANQSLEKGQGAQILLSGHTAKIKSPQEEKYLHAIMFQSKR